jgi:Arc/MetJ family transcription regulator
MRTNIVIDPALMDKVMEIGQYKTKKEAVEAGLALLARQAAYREVRKWRGKLHWTGHDEPWNNDLPAHQWTVQTPTTLYSAGSGSGSGSNSGRSATHP